MKLKEFIKMLFARFSKWRLEFIKKLSNACGNVTIDIESNDPPIRTGGGTTP